MFTLIRLLIFLFISFIPLISKGQTFTYFNNIYDVNQGLEVAWNIIEVDTGYIIEGGFGIDTIYPNNWLIGILFIDKLGTEKWRRYYSIKGTSVNTNYYSGFPGSFNPVPSGGYALGGSIVRDSTANGDVVLWRFDEKPDTLWTRIYEDTIWATAYHSVPTPDGGFMLTGGYGGNVMMLMKTDSNGTKEWMKTYPSASASTHVIVTPDSGYLSGNANDSYPYYHGYVIKTDKNGNEQWHYETDTVIPWIGAYCITRDSCYLLVGRYFDSIDINLDLYKGHFVFIKLDKNGNEKWKKIIGHIYDKIWDPYRIHQIADGSFLFVGQGIVDGIGSNADELKGVALKISEQGDSIWYREYRYCYLEDVWTIQYFRWGIPTSDGGYIFCGFTSPSACVRQNMWVVKTNCLGFEAPPKAHFYWSRDTSMLNTIIFTNTSLYSDSSLYFFGDGTDSMVRNATNYQIDDTVTFFSHTYPDTGYYIVTAIAWACGDTNIFTDTVYVTNVGIEEYIYRGENIFIKNYPNPFQIQTTIYVNLNDLESNCDLTISAISGIRIKSIPLSQGENSIIVKGEDLPSGGIYFYSIVEKCRRIITRKLVFIQ